MSKEIFAKIEKLIDLYRQGKLGGEVMPEDANPRLDKNSQENLLYFTLPMALNYQRNSYKLWESALATWKDKEIKDVFNPNAVVNMGDDELRQKLLKYKVALQPNKQPIIWRTICQTIVDDFNGDLRNLFSQKKGNIIKIKDYITCNKKRFPYLSGCKILNYWLYVIGSYTNIAQTNRWAITIAPDTHVLQASVKLGVIKESELLQANIRETTSARWAEILKGTNVLPIDLHTPFWLWSRNGFKYQI